MAVREQFMRRSRRYICHLHWILALVFLCGCSPKVEESLVETALLEEQEIPETDMADAKTEEPEMVIIYVCGEVWTPGVYTLEAGSRIGDAVKAAGGMTEEADETFLNQAQILLDGEKIYVPSKEEAAGGGIDEPGNWNAKVSINRAGKEQLMTLAGIGESKAEAIIAYRESHGGFQSLEELMHVDGIKEGTYEKIKDLISL